MEAFSAYSPKRAYKRIDNRKQLFLDNDIIAVIKNIKRTFTEPVKHQANPVIKQDRPWENFVYFRTSNYTVLHDEQDGLFKCWYEDLVDGYSCKARQLYAVSTNGLHWEKPQVGLVKDGKRTNIIWEEEGGGIHSPSFLIDYSEANPSHRFKAVYCREKPGLNVPKRTTMASTFSDGLSLAFSPDGVNWTPYDGNPILSEYGSDVEILTWDPIDKKYVLTCRAIHVADSPHPDSDNLFLPYCPDQPDGIYCPRRKVSRMVSDDCISWSEPVVISETSPNDDLQEAHYGMTTWRVGEYHLGFLMILQQVDDTVYFELVYSRDGYNWKRLRPGQSVIPRGESGSYDSLMIECPSPLVTVGREHWIYYAGASCHHDYWESRAGHVSDVPQSSLLPNARTYLGLARIGVDRWVSLAAMIREGYVETKPVYSEGSKLIINAKCHPGGYLAVEVMDNWNNTWAGFTRQDCDVFTGDEVSHTVSWKGQIDINSIPGCIKLRFHMKQAELYSFRIAET